MRKETDHFNNLFALRLTQFNHPVAVNIRAFFDKHIHVKAISPMLFSIQDRDFAEHFAS